MSHEPIDRVSGTPLPLERSSGLRRWWLAFWFCALACVRGVGSERPADGLLRLVPSDVAAALAVEDLRGQAVGVVHSPLFQRLAKLPSVRGWMASEPFRKFQSSSRDVLRTLEVSLDSFRDEILGDAVVLALRADPIGDPGRAKGLLLVKPRDRPTAERLIRALDDAQFRAGELGHVEGHFRGEAAYSARHFKAVGRPTEFYAFLDDGTFAWSNSEPLILEVLDRKASGRAGLSDQAGFREVRRGLPDHPLASLFVDPRFLERAMAGEPKPVDDRLTALLARYVRAVGRLGLSLHWRDGIFVHSCESIAPEKLEPWAKDWLAGPSKSPVFPAQVSPSTVALVSSNLDFHALGEAIAEVVGEEGRPTLENLKIALQGILLGRRLADVVPRLLPEGLLAVEIEPDRSIRPIFPIIGAFGWTNPPGGDDLATPVDNVLRTILALALLDPKRQLDHLRIEPKDAGGRRMTVLTDGLRTILAYRVDRDRLVVGNSAEAVARFGTGSAPSVFSDIRARSLPEAETFAIVDLSRLVLEVRSLRGPLARTLAARSKRPVADAYRDLGDLIGVADQFRAAVFTSSSKKDATEVRRSIGLIAR